MIGSVSTDIRLVAIDLDGTLLDASKKVCGRAARSLPRLPAIGVRVVLASARPPRSVRHIYQQLKLDTWQINYNGALIWDEPGRRVVRHTPMEPALVSAIVHRARDMFEEVLVSCEILDRWYTDRFDQAYTTETGRLFKPDRVAPLEEFCAQPVTKLLLLGSPQLIARLEPLLVSEFPQASVLWSDPELLQVMNSEASKAAALRRVAAHYRVPLKNVMAIGDAANDVSMLEIAGVAVAMDNASAVAKRAAHWVAPSHNDHGVHAALERYILKKSH